MNTNPHRYDPSNPVVCYDGALKPILFNRMKDAADTSDLVIVLGTRYFLHTL